MRYNRYWVKFSISNIRGTGREIHERQYSAVSEKALRQSVRNRWANSKPRILKVKLLETVNG